jgi:hypothetical protein
VRGRTRLQASICGAPSARGAAQEVPQVGRRWWNLFRQHTKAPNTAQLVKRIDIPRWGFPSVASSAGEAADFKRTVGSVAGSVVELGERPQAIPQAAGDRADPLSRWPALSPRTVFA